nr:fibronectin type III domain-containing protein [Candidatus Sigynarchaeota archaeon]
MMVGPRWGLITTLKGQKTSKIIRTLFINIIITASLIVPFLLFTVAREMERDDVNQDKLPWLRWFGDPRTSVSISWETRLNSSSSVAFGVDPENLLDNVSMAGECTMHHVDLEGLMPGTRYFYRVSDHNGLFSFWTAPATGNES